MPYIKQNGARQYGGTTLVSRQSYSDLGADITTNCRISETSTMVRGADGKEYDWGAQAKQVPVCTSSGGTLSQIGSFFKGLLGGAVSLYGSSKTAEGQAEAYRQMQQQQRGGGTPGWVLPVMIGGVGLAAVVMLSGRRKNPARRRSPGRLRR
jgi:hypothetical protein